MMTEIAALIKKCEKSLMNTSLILCVIFLPVWLLVIRGGGGLVQLSTPLTLVQVHLIHPIIITRVTELVGDANLSLCVCVGGGVRYLIIIRVQ